MELGLPRPLSQAFDVPEKISEKRPSLMGTRNASEILAFQRERDWRFCGSRKGQSCRGGAMGELFSGFFFRYLLLAAQVAGVFYIVALPWLGN